MDTVKRAFLGSFDASAISKVVIVGGLARSGTTSLDAALNACPSCFMCDEFNDMLILEVRHFFNRLQTYHRNEGRHWLDESGRTWRGMDADDHSEAAAHALSQTLLAFTNPQKFAGKRARDIRVLGFKHPRIECGVQMFRNTFPSADVVFIYAAREPVAVMKSQWAMPWTREADPEDLAARLIKDYERSLGHLDVLAERGIRTIVFRTGIDKVEGLLQDLGIQPAREGEDWRTDTWPSERRRSVEPIPDDIVERFSHSETVIAFRQAMALSATE